MSRSTDLEGRVRRLERINHALLAALGLGAVLVLTAAAARNGPGTVDATRFRLVDESGALLAELRSTPGGTGLYVLDETGTERASIHHNDEETALYLRDSEGTIRVGAAQFAHGGGGLALHGEGARGATVLYMKDLRGSLRMYDAEGGVVYQAPPVEGEEGR